MPRETGRGQAKGGVCQALQIGRGILVFYSSPDDGGVSRGGQVPGGAGAALLRILAAMFSNLNHGWSQGGRGPVSSLSGGKVTAAAFWLGPAATFFILSRSVLLAAPLLIFPAYFPFPPLPEADTGLFS